MSISSGERNGKKYRLYLVRAIYLGSEPMGELLDGENGSDAVQVPLKRTILRTDGEGEEVDLIITDEALCINFVKAEGLEERQKTMALHIESLAYCGALRQLPSERVQDREFETLDKIPNDPTFDDPPLFVAIFRSLENENTLLCHSFVIRKDVEAMELVQNVMESYYNVVGQIENAESNSSHGDKHLSYVENQNHEYATKNGAVYTTADGVRLTQSELDRLLADHRTSTLDQQTQSILSNRGNSQFVAGDVSARDILEKSLDPSQYEVIRGESFTNTSDINSKTIKEYPPLNQDEDPVIIKKKNDEPLVYKQNVYIRWLQPPTPPPPAPIIIREVPEPRPEPLPPLVVYKQSPREKTPPPLIIREKPPSPLRHTEPLIIERRVAAPEPQPRRVIVEELPPPPPKPRDIILEKWLPREAPKRPVVVERVPPNRAIAYNDGYTRSRYSNYQYNNRVYPNYDYVEPTYQHQNTRLNTNYEVVERSRAPAKRIIRHVIRPVKTNSQYADVSYGHEAYRRHGSPVSYPIYSTQQYIQKPNKPLVTGYRVIRQIIPGPNATAADIERALARSQNLNTYSGKNGIYSPPQHRRYDNYEGYSQSPPHGRPINNVHAAQPTGQWKSDRDQAQFYRSSSVE